MKRFLVVAVLAIGAALLPAAAYCQTETDATVLKTQSNSGSPAQAQIAADAAKAQAGSVAVEDQATKEQVDRLFDVMRLRQQMETMMKQMSTMMQQQVSTAMKDESSGQSEGKRTTPEQMAARQQLIAKFMDRATTIYTVDEMFGDIIPIYQRHISRSDIEALISFFGSSAGQHLLEQQPLIAQEYMPLVMKRVQDKTKTLTDELKKNLEELNAKENPDANGPAAQ